MTMHEQWTDQLSDFLDGELSSEEQAALEAHLRDCPECIAILNDLKRIVARAQTLDARPPQGDIWNAIAARIDAAPADAHVIPFASRSARRVTFTWGQLAAAAAILVAVSGGMTWRLASRAGRSAEVARSAKTTATANDTEREASAEQAGGGSSADRVMPAGLADAQYDAAVTDLEKALKDGRGRLDASTIAIVEHNLQIIDSAIDQARQALVEDPANSYLSGHLVEARRRKLDLLRRATALTESN
jgi:Putative zinc-finger